jgi:hypothetical protein
MARSSGRRRGRGVAVAIARSKPPPVQAGKGPLSPSGRPALSFVSRNAKRSATRAANWGPSPHGMAMIERMTPCCACMGAKLQDSPLRSGICPAAARGMA